MKRVATVQGVPKNPKTIEITYCWHLNALALVKKLKYLCKKYVCFARGNIDKNQIE